MADQIVPQVSCRKGAKVDKDLERSCDVIATELLMPRELFSQAADGIGWTLDSVRQLSRQFQVTIQAAALRLFELTTQPLVISVWQTRKDPMLGLRSKWSRTNHLGKSLKPSVSWKSGAEAIQPIYEAFQAQGIATGSCQVLLTRNGSRNYRSVPSEAIGVGRGTGRTVIGFHYLDNLA